MKEKFKQTKMAYDYYSSIYPDYIKRKIRDHKTIVIITSIVVFIAAITGFIFGIKDAD